MPATAGTLCCNRKAAGSATSQDAEAGMLVPVAFGGNNTKGPIDVATACRAKGGTGHGDFESETFLVEPTEPFSFKPSHFTRGKDGAPSEVFPALTADADKGDQDPCVCAPVPVRSAGSGTSTGAGIGLPGDPMFTLDTTATAAVCAPFTFDEVQVTHPENRSQPQPGKPCHTLAKENAAKAAVAFSLVPESGQGADLRASQVDIATAVTTEEAKMIDRGIRVVHPIPIDIRNASRTAGSGAGTAGTGVGQHGDPCTALTKQVVPGVAAASTQWRVRRLTVTEAERLQGFPDGYTLVEFRGKPAADSPRYKAVGNSMAVPVMRWVAERIQMVEDFPY